MIHPNTELRFVSESIGYGVFATEAIPAGTIVYVKDSLELVVSPTDYLIHDEAMREVIDKYSYIDPAGNRIISWDFAKYVNHCCNCNTISTGYGFEIAIRDIHPGEQITDEYGIFNLDKEMVLDCGQEGCRKIIRPNDFDDYYQQWDDKIKRVFPTIFKVNQPLMPFIDLETRQELDAFFRNPSDYKSVYALRLKSEVPQNNHVTH